MPVKSRIVFAGSMALLFLSYCLAGVGPCVGASANPDATSSAPADQPTDRAASGLQREQMILRVVQLAQAGRVPEAREDLRAYLRKNPRDATMYYNLTCLDLFLKETDQALADLELALTNGYSNFRLIDNDRDLVLLHKDPRYTEMVSRFENDYRKVFHASTLYLDEGIRTEGLFLKPQNAGSIESPAPKPEVSIEFNGRELLVTVDVVDASYNDGAPPWQGGCGVLVNLVFPLSPDDYESKRYFSYGFFAKEGRPEAALVGKHGQVLLQSIPSLKPQITPRSDGARYEISIPWERFAPYAPPLDQDMGLNIFYVGASQAGSRPVFSLMSEDRLSFEANPWRRYVPVSFFPGELTEPVMRGRLYEQLCESETVGVQLALWSKTEGSARCRFSIQSQKEPELTIGTPVEEIFPCETELNFFNHSLDISELPGGSFQLSVEVTGSDGLTFSEVYPFDNFEMDWISSLNERVHAIDSPEQSILRYHLFSLSRKIDIRHPHDDASGLHQARADVVRMIELCETGSSCLPAGGLFRGGFTSDVMTQRFCSMYLPKGHKSLRSPHLLVVLPPEPGSEDDLARNLGTALEGKTDTIVLVPQSNGFSSLATDKAANHTLLAIQWAQSLFQSGAVTLVGLGKGTEAALEASLRRPDLCQEILLDVDPLFQDLNGFSKAGIMEVLGSRPNQRPYTLVSKSPAAGRPRLIEGAMAQLGLQVKTILWDPSLHGSVWLPSWFLSSH
jgi:hypothetical protein